MYILANIILCLFPVVALILLIIGIQKNAIYYIISSLWLSLISLIIHFQSSGGQILGSYFNYFNSAVYTLNLIVLFISFARVISHLSANNLTFNFIGNLFKSVILMGIVLVITNLWINAYFIENRMPRTPVMQVALFSKPDYCSYKYIFYKVAVNGTVVYLCPDHYGLIPSMGDLAISPDFIASQLSLPNKKQMLFATKN